MTGEAAGTFFAAITDGALHKTFGADLPHCNRRILRAESPQEWVTSESLSKTSSCWTAFVLGLFCLVGSWPSALYPE